MENLSLLLVDDEPDVLLSLKLWLQDEGYSVYTATTKEEALLALEEYPIAVCLIDLRMKDVSGLQVSRELTNLDDLLKVIIMTGYPTYETAIDAMKTGVYDYISKESDHDEILKRIKKAVGARQNEIAVKTGKTDAGQNLVLVCHHLMIREGFEQFCREEPSYNLSHTYSTFDHIKPNDFNINASLVLPCAGCNQKHFQNPGSIFPRLKSYFPHAKILMINSQFSDEEKRELIKLGVKGFLPKNSDKENMKKAFEVVLSGQMWVSRKVANEVLNELLAKTSGIKQGEHENKYELSHREIEMIQAMASGLSNSEISNKLFISEKTVKAHIYNIFKKMEVKSRTQAIMKAVESRII